MKKSWVLAGIFVLLIFVLASYFLFFSNSVPSKYQMTLQSELNPSDYHTPGKQIKETSEVYNSGSNWYRIQIMEFSDVNLASEGISIMKETYNPSMIVLDKKYVNYLENSQDSRYYFYQSGKNILFLDISSNKGEADSFVSWFYLKYPNKVN